METATETEIETLPPAVLAKPLAWLSDGAVRAKLRALIDLRDTLENAAQGANARAERARDALSTARAALTRFQNEVSNSGFREEKAIPLESRNGLPAFRVVPDKSQRSRLEATLKEAEQDAARANAAANEANEAAGPARTLVASVEAYLVRLGPAGLSKSEPAAPVKLKAGTDPVLELDRVRSQIAAQHLEVGEVIAAPIPLVEVKAAIRRQIEGLAARGRPSVEGLFINRGNRIAFGDWRPSIRVTTSTGSGFSTSNLDDAIGLTCWLYTDDVIAALCAEAEALAGDDAGALSDEERAARLSDLRAKILGLERVEEALIGTAAERGVALPRRGGADPRAVLEIAGKLPAPQVTR